MNKGDPISLVHQILAKDRGKLGSTSSMHSFPKHLTTFPGLLKSSELTFKQKLFLRITFSSNTNLPPRVSLLLKVDHHLQHLHLQLIHLVDCLLSPGIALLQSHQGLQQLPVGLPVKTLEKKIYV